MVAYLLHEKKAFCTLKEHDGLKDDLSTKQQEGWKRVASAVSAVHIICHHIDAACKQWHSAWPVSPVSLGLTIYQPNLRCNKHQNIAHSEAASPFN